MNLQTTESGSTASLAATINFSVKGLLQYDKVKE